ncbi:MAG: RdgB/HAM1 family non-canonical purine NTP pyrophosphatase [Victivallaceae bacterium]|nr:RdgB/HAM1 family non-canonical purine NTP pyrophosphatase [Victivallaceae bacterium]
MAYIVAATRNEHKVEEYKELLKDQNVEIRSLNEYPGFEEVEETGSTFQENAELKAVAACKYCDVPAFADDSGLEVEALNGAPGIYSARYAGTNSTRIARVLEELKGKDNRRARFTCVIAIAVNGEAVASFTGHVGGVIVETSRGEGGFGYDPIFQPDGHDQTFGEMSADQKNRISHRAMACKAAIEFFEDEMSVLDEDFD